MRTRLAAVLALAAAAAIAAGTASGRGSETPGVTPTSILLGATVPLSGEAAAAAAVSRGSNAYFQYVNSKGGVFGRKISYKVVDDGYDPSRTVQAIRSLVQDDKVFAVYGSLGTNQNLAIRDFLNDQGVPQLFVFSGAHTFGVDFKKYPWTMGYIPSYVTEGVVLGRHIRATSPKAKVGILFQDDAYGKDVVAGLRIGLGAKGVGQIVKEVGYDPTSADVQSQVAELKASGADLFAVVAFGKFAIQAYVYADKLGWHPKSVVNDVATSASVMRISPARATEGALSIVFVKDPTDRRWTQDAGMVLYRQVMRRFCSKCDTDDAYHLAGMASAFTMVDTLRRAGKNLTREGLLKAATSLDEPKNAFLLPGITVHTTPTYRFPISQVQLQRWHLGNWVPFGPILRASG